MNGLNGRMLKGHEGAIRVGFRAFYRIGAFGFANMPEWNRGAQIRSTQRFVCSEMQSVDSGDR